MALVEARSADSSTRKAADIAGKLVLAVVSSLVTLAIALLLVRYLGYEADLKTLLRTGCTPSPMAISDERLYHHVLKPCTRFVEEGYMDGDRRDQLEFRTDVVVNSLGFRNDEYEVEKTPGTSRVVILGDSFTYGFGLDLEQTFFKKLETKLTKQLQHQVEVWNLAVISWATVIHERVVRERVRAYSPDVVIVAFDLSDFADNVAYADARLPDGTFPQLGPGTLDKFFADRARVHGFLRRVTPLGEPEYVALKDRVAKLALHSLSEIAAMLRAADVPLLVVFYPYPWNPFPWEGEMLERLQAELREAGVQILDMSAPIKQRGYRALYFAKNWHWNAEGSTFVADLLANDLSARFGPYLAGDDKPAPKPE